MKRLSFVLSLIAVSTVTLFVTSCSKDENSIRNVEYIENTDLPTFSYLYSYIGRTDITAIENYFIDKGFDIRKGCNISNGDSVLDVAMNDTWSEFFQFVYQNGKVYQGLFCIFHPNEISQETTVKLIRLLNNENDFTQGKNPLAFNASLHIINPDREMVEYQTKADLLSDIQRLYDSTDYDFTFGCNILYESYSTFIQCQSDTHTRGGFTYGISTKY